MFTVTLFLLLICFKLHVLNIIAIAKLVFLKMDCQQECHKKVIEIFNEKPCRLKKTIARLASVNHKTVSMVILKQYKQSLSIERKPSGSGAGRSEQQSSLERS